MSTPTNDPETTSADPTESQPDVQSDPALDDGESADWSSEGGAPSEGPATDTDNS